MRTAVIWLCCSIAALCLCSIFYFWTVAGFLASDTTRPRAIYDIKAWSCLFVLAIAANVAILIFWKKKSN